MAHLLILDFGDDRKPLIAALERHHRVKAATTAQEALTQLEQNNRPYDVVLFDLSRNRRSDWEALDCLVTGVRQNSGPMILCICDTYYGPEMKLEVEGKGGRLVWI